MTKLRKVKTATGATAIQVVHYENRETKIDKHIGSGTTATEITELEKRGKHWINQMNPQGELFPDKETELISLSDIRIEGITNRFAYNFLEKVAKRCKIPISRDKFLFDFAIMRMIEPESKLRSIKLLSRYFGIEYSERTVYRKIKVLHEKKGEIEKIAINCAKELLKDDLAIILYDVTTLYFETFEGDELRVAGYSKDNKPNQPQIMIGLLVTREGFPVGYEVFAGNTYEGSTILLVLKNFIAKHKVKSPVVVADAAMLTSENIKELKEMNFSYIVGARMGSTAYEKILGISREIKKKDGKIIKQTTDNGDFIVQFSKKRYNKDKYEMDRQIERAKEAIEKKNAVKKLKFVMSKSRKSQYIIDKKLIKKAKALLGLKGYFTNITSKEMSDQEIINRYHDLWQIEKSFRIAKSDLATRPIYHHREVAVKSHILICFTALILTKYLEINLKQSIKQIIDLIWQVKEVTLIDKITNTSYTITTEVPSEFLSVFES